MSFPLRKNGRFFRSVIAVIAVMGLELDVLCNPFAPTFLLHWLTSSRLDLQSGAVDFAWGADPFGDEDLDIEAGESTTDASDSLPTESTPQFGLTSELAEAIAIRPPTRAPYPAFVCTPGSMTPPWAEPINHSQQHGSSFTSHLSLQARLCRFRC